MQTVEWFDFLVDYDNVPLPLHGVYRVTCLVTGLVYVGSSKNMEKRFSLGWRAEARKGKTLLGRTMRLYGPSNFLVEPIFYSFGKEGLEEAELSLISAYDCVHPNGYNAVLATGNGIFKAAQANPEIEAGRCEKIRAYCRTETVQISFAERMRLIWATGTMRENRAKAFSNPEVQARRSAAIKAAMTSAVIAKSHTKEANVKRIISMRETWSNPELRAEHSKKIAAACARPEVAARKSSAMTEVNARPEVRAKHATNTANLIWITNGTKSSRIPKDQPIPEGWIRGKGMWITNGAESRTIPPNQAIPNGWSRGRTI